MLAADLDGLIGELPEHVFFLWGDSAVIALPLFCRWKGVTSHETACLLNINETVRGHREFFFGSLLQNFRRRGAQIGFENKAVKALIRV